MIRFLTDGAAPCPTAARLLILYSSLQPWRRFYSFESALCKPFRYAPKHTLSRTLRRLRRGTPSAGERRGRGAATVHQPKTQSAEPASEPPPQPACGHPLAT